MAYLKFDIPCPTCGYNLRGLPLGKGCPECGLKVVSLSPIDDERARAQRIDAEIDANLRAEEEAADRERFNALLDAWKRRGERFDAILEQIERLLAGPETNGEGDRARESDG